MASSRDLATRQLPTWCPGCGNYSIWGALKSALEKIDADPEKTLIVFGIGCHGNGADFIKTYVFHALHGRALPVATGAKLANHKLRVIVVSGDGDCYGIGLNHFIQAVRRNLDITLISHNNQVYGLTTGQTSPTSDTGFVTKSTPHGVLEMPVNPLALALAAGGTFVSRGFAGDMPYMTELMIDAFGHRGFSVLDILQPCVTFNKKNTYPWFRERVRKLGADYDPSDRVAAFREATSEFNDDIPLGCFYRESRPTYEDGLPQLKGEPLVKQDIMGVDISRVLETMA